MNIIQYVLSFKILKNRCKWDRATNKKEKLSYLMQFIDPILHQVDEHVDMFDAEMNT